MPFRHDPNPLGMVQLHHEKDERKHHQQKQHRPQRNGTPLPIQRKNKQLSKLSDENCILLDIFKNPEKVRSIDWKNKDQNSTFDDEVVKSEIMSRFRNPRDP
jgi:hypothetical protein